MEVKVLFIPDKSNPPVRRNNNRQARATNTEARNEMREILKLIKIGQSFKVWGLEYSRVTSIVHGLLKDAQRGGKSISVSFRRRDDYIQVWRSA